MREGTELHILAPLLAEDGRCRERDNAHAGAWTPALARLIASFSGTTWKTASPLEKALV